MQAVRKLFARTDENERRGNWAGRLDYGMVTLSTIIGFPEIWRTPYEMLHNGGLGAWCIPLLFWTVVVGIPLLYLEISWGQFAGIGAISMWNISPILKGIGYSVTLVCLLTSSYVVSLIGGHILVLVRTLSSSHYEAMFSCGNPWNTPTCTDKTTEPVYNITFNNITFYNITHPTLGATPPMAEFVNRKIFLTHMSSMGYLGYMNWPLFAGMTAACVIIFLVVALGPRGVGRVAYVTTLLPVVFGFCLLVRAGSLEGASLGVKYLTYPNYWKLAELNVWFESLHTVLIGLGVGYSVHQTLASYNKFQDKSMAEAVLVPFVQLILTSLIGVVISSYVGFLSLAMNKNIYHVMSSRLMVNLGVMPEALHLLPGGRGWIIIFLLSVILSAIGSQMCVTLTITTAVVDELPVKVFSRRVRHVIVTAVVCCATFLIGISCVTVNAVGVIHFMDNSVSILPKLFLFIQCCVISWLYGFSRIFEDLSLMYGARPFWIWKPMWGVVAPLFVLVAIIINLIIPISTDMAPAHELGGRLLRLAVLLPVPVLAIIHVIRMKSTDMSKAFGPGLEWGPQVDAHRETFHASCGRVPLAQFATAPYGPVSEAHEMKPEV